MRGYWIGLVFLCGCSSPNVERQAVADGTWRIKCKFGLEQCVKEVEKVCPDPTYLISGGNSLRKLYGVEPGKTEIRTSELTVTCGRDAIEQAQAKSQAVDAAAPIVTRATLCTPGATQSCLGPGACPGAQACRTDGAGFMPCDCGSTPKAVPVDAGIADAAPRQ
jgi:hypothetical protein